MQNIHAKDTTIEIVLRKALWNKGYRYRKNCKDITGHPDIVLTKYKIAIFCDGEFFHGKDWASQKLKVLKSNNSDYWISKIERNMERDRENEQALIVMGWTVIRFWSKDIIANTDECVRTIVELVQQQKYNMVHF